jgi:hypothetical protein
MKKTPDELKKDLSAVIDPTVARLLVDSYLEMQQRYYDGDWKPSELDGGRFCEAVARAIYELDTGATTTLGVGAICDRLRQTNPSPQHQLKQDKDRDHFCRVLQAIYKLRNDRNIAHISVTDGHDANQMDAALIVGTVKWLFGEFLRLAQKFDRKEVVALIESIIQLEHPLIHELDGQPQVMHTGLSIGEEALLLLRHSPQGRATKDQLRKWIPKSNPQSINMAVLRLMDARQVRLTEDGEVSIDPLGQKRVSEEILPKIATDNASSTSARARRATMRRKTSNRARKSPARVPTTN